MATSRGFDQFARRMTIVAKDIGEGVGRVVRRAALVADQSAVLLTPVDTGRARANWIATLGAPAQVADRQPDKTGQTALDQAAGVIARFKAGGGGGRDASGRFTAGSSIYLTNNVEYTGFLDQGSSRQAPEGMSAKAAQAAVNSVRGARIVRG